MTTATSAVREHGLQPLDALMIEGALSNEALVIASSGRLTFKQIGKARKGRRLTLRTQRKLVEALSSATGREWRIDELFTYRGN